MSQSGAHMRRKGDHIAFYVDNYPTVEDTVNNTRMFATVLEILES